MPPWRCCIVFRFILACVILAGCTQLDGNYGMNRLNAPSRLPEPRTTYLDLGRELLRTGENELAKDAFIRAMRVEGMIAAALTGAGMADERQGRLHDAQRFFERALLQAPDSVLAHNNLGAVLYRQGELYQARRAFQAAFALSDGKSWTAEHNLKLTDLAIERASANDVQLVPNPVPLQREGTGVYRLMGATAAPQTHRRGADSVAEKENG